jgi:hypothetical protein
VFSLLFAYPYEFVESHGILIVRECVRVYVKIVAEHGVYLPEQVILRYCVFI